MCHNSGNLIFKHKKSSIRDADTIINPAVTHRRTIYKFVGIRTR